MGRKWAGPRWSLLPLCSRPARGLSRAGPSRRRPRRAARRPAQPGWSAGNRLVDSRTDDEIVPCGVKCSSFDYACAQGWGFLTLDNRVAYPAAALA